MTLCIYYCCIQIKMIIKLWLSRMQIIMIKRKCIEISHTNALILTSSTRYEISCNLQAKCYYDLWWIIAVKLVKLANLSQLYDVIVVSRLHTSITILNLFNAYISLTCDCSTASLNRKLKQNLNGLWRHTRERRSRSFLLPIKLSCDQILVLYNG